MNFREGNEAAVLNGFSVCTEPLTLRVAPRAMAPYSLPREALIFQPSDAARVVRFSDGDSERMVFCNTPLEPEEQQWLHDCRKEAARRGIALWPSLTVAAGRYLGNVRGDVHRALESLQATQSWRADFWRQGPVTDELIWEDMKLGIIYFSGRDSSMRPALVIRPGRIPVHLAGEAHRFNRMVAFCNEYFLRYMVVPGKVESYCVVVDLQGASLSQFQYSAIKKIAPVFVNQDAGRVSRFYVCNLPLAVRPLTGLVNSLMTVRQRQKLVFVTDPKALRKDFALHQLEEDLGGSRPPITEFLPFPLLPGPFEAGSTAGPDEDAIANVHEVTTEASARGRLWDPSLGYAENTGLEFATTPHAAGLLEACGVAPVEPAQGCQTWGPTASAADAPSAAIPQRGPVEVDDEVVAPNSVFSCSCRIFPQKPVRVSLSC